MKRWSKTFMLLVFSTFLSFTVQAQKKTLTILPYTGDVGGDEEAVTSLLARHEDLHREFSIVPCDRNFIDLGAEIESGDFTQTADVIAEVKSRLNADFVLMVRADTIEGVGLTILSLFDTGTLRQTAGYYRKGGVRDVRTVLPDITKRIIAGAQPQPDLEKVSILPFYSRVDGEDGDILFQLLSIELTNSGKYAVFPWALMTDNLTNHRNIHSSYGIVDPISLKDFGKETNIRSILTGDLLSVENANLFMASMIPSDPGDTGTGSYTTGTVEYTAIPASLDKVAWLAKVLTGGTAPVAVTPGVANPPERSPVIDSLPSFPEPGSAKTAQAPAKVTQARSNPIEFYDIYETMAPLYAPIESAPEPAEVPAPLTDAPMNPYPPAPTPAPRTPAQTRAPAAPRDVLDPSKPILTILPFGDKTGEDEETITILLANQEELRNAFNVIPSETSFDALMRDIGSQNYRSGADFTQALRNQLQADYALLVRAETIGAGRIALISLIRMDTLQQISGKHQRYGAVREVRSGLPDIAKGVIRDVQNRPNPALPNLTVLPFYTPSGREIKDANILFQYLTIELSNSGKYTVYPWALPIETQVGGFKGAYFGVIDPETIKIFGAATQMRYILTGDLLNLGTTNLFMSSIVDTQNAAVLNEGDLEYRLLMEDMGLVTDLSSMLITGRPRQVPAGTPPSAPARIPAASTADDRWAEPAKEASRPAVGTTQSADTLKDFVKIPAGTFTMGTSATEVGRDADEVQHAVSVPSFYLAKNEVTQAEYEALMGVNPSYFKQYPNLPVEQVNWFEAVAYCNALSAKEGLTPAYTVNGETVTWNREANGYRLPTEAEWEYACRAGTTTTFNTGDMFTAQDGNFDGTYPYKNTTSQYRERTMPAGSFKPNGWGLYDMHGNVYEWCWDWYEPYNAGARTGTLSVNRIVRGGSWYSALRYLRSGNRIQVAPAVRVYYVGFRVARNLTN